MAEIRKRFWENIPLDKMSREEWEALCDHCGRCCLLKLEDEETGRIYFTNLICAQYDLAKSRCSSYSSRFCKVPDCRAITMESLAEIEWLPPDCAYVRLYNGQPLPDWHPLAAGHEAAVDEAHMRASAWAISEKMVDPDDWEDHVVHSPFGPYEKKNNKRQKCPQ